MKTPMEIGERTFESVVTLTIGVLILASGLWFYLIATGPCDFIERVVCGPTTNAVGLLWLTAGVALVVTGIFWAAVFGRGHRAKMR